MFGCRHQCKNHAEMISLISLVDASFLRECEAKKCLCMSHDLYGRCRYIQTNRHPPSVDQQIYSVSSPQRAEQYVLQLIPLLRLLDACSMHAFYENARRRSVSVRLTTVRREEAQPVVSLWTSRLQCGYLWVPLGVLNGVRVQSYTIGDVWLPPGSSIARVLGQSVLGQSVLWQCSVCDGALAQN